MDIVRNGFYSKENFSAGRRFSEKLKQFTSLEHARFPMILLSKTICKGVVTVM